MTLKVSEEKVEHDVKDKNDAQDLITFVLVLTCALVLVIFTWIYMDFIGFTSKAVFITVIHTKVQTATCTSNETYSND